MRQALSTRLSRLELSRTAVDPLVGFPCIRAWRHGNGAKPQFRCVDRLLWKYFCIQDKPRTMIAVRAEVDAIASLLFDALAAWEPAWPSGDQIADARYILSRPAWLCLFQNYWQLVDCVQRHRNNLTFNGDLPVPYDAGEASMAGTVHLLFVKDLSPTQQADAFMQTLPCHPHP